MSIRKKAGVLGATGSVGQRFISLLANHPGFEITALGASARSAGKTYKAATAWKLSAVKPKSVDELMVVECTVANFKHCDVVFSGLEAEFADSIEREFVDAGINIVSNAKSYRRDSSVPLVVPTCNPEHLDMVASHKAKGKGVHVCISNCSTAGVVVPLKALQDQFGPIQTVVLTTMQAVSGAGFSPGVPSMDAIDNLVPYIGSEEDKLEWEPRKILGAGVNDNNEFKVIPQDQMRISASCNRVPVTDGHTACVAFKFAGSKPPLAEVQRALRDFQSQCQTLKCHSAPENIIELFVDEPNRPQPRLDRDLGNGYTVSVGRVRDDPVLDYKFVCLSHNTVLGAAGSGILIAELLVAKKLI